MKRKDESPTRLENLSNHYSKCDLQMTKTWYKSVMDECDKEKIYTEPVTKRKFFF